MSFIEQSEQNVDRLMKEVSTGGVAGFVGGKGMGIDALFAGPYHPDSGYGSKNKQLLAKQLKDRKEKRKDIESSRDGVIDDYSGLADPVGGYYETDTEVARLAYEELETRNQMSIDYSIENTPLQDTEWAEVETNLEYDEIISYIEEEDFINASETNMEYVGTLIDYDDNKPIYDKELSDKENFINQSETNWEIINRG